MLRIQPEQAVNDEDILSVKYEGEMDGKNRESISRVTGQTGNYFSCFSRPTSE